jgi:hypothetical protein
MKRNVLILGLAALALMAVGCAITDYEGHPNHQTQAEAKFLFAEISFIVGDPDYDGTYAYTAKYDNRGTLHDPNLKLYTYRNPVPSSFSRDGQIDRDGDDVQGSGGILGGKFLPQWTVTDPAPGCQFFANRIQSQGGAPPPIIAFCDTVEEEVDKDLDLQASFASTGDLLAKIWSGAVSGGFTAELNGVVINGTTIPLSQAISIGITSNGTRPTRISVDLTQPGGKGLIQALLNNTQNGVPVSIGLQFAGGMAVDLPSRVKATFDHDALFSLL